MKIELSTEMIKRLVRNTLWEVITTYSNGQQVSINSTDVEILRGLLDTGEITLKSDFSETDAMNAAFDEAYRIATSYRGDTMNFIKMIKELRCAAPWTGLRLAKRMMEWGIGEYKKNNPVPHE